MIILAAGGFEIVTILEIISKIPSIIDEITRLASQLRLGYRGSGDINKLRQELDDLMKKLKEHGTLGYSVKDYVGLLGISTDNNNSVDFILKSLIPRVKETEDQEAKELGVEKKLGDILKEDYEHHVYIKFTKGLNTFFTVERYIDKGDKEKIETLLRQIDNALSKGRAHMEHGDYEKLEYVLKDVWTKLTEISGLCTTRIDNITERLIAYKYQIL